MGWLENDNALCPIYPHSPSVSLARLVSSIQPSLAGLGRLHVHLSDTLQRTVMLPIGRKVGLAFLAQQTYLSWTSLCILHLHSSWRTASWCKWRLESERGSAASVPWLPHFSKATQMHLSKRSPAKAYSPTNWDPELFCVRTSARETTALYCRMLHDIVVTWCQNTFDLWISALWGTPSHLEQSCFGPANEKEPHPLLSQSISYSAFLFSHCPQFSQLPFLLRLVCLRFAQSTIACCLIFLLLVQVQP